MHMAEDVLTDAYLTVVNAMSDRTPRALARRAAAEAADIDESADVSLSALVKRLQNASVNDPLRQRIHRALATWDGVDEGDWVDETVPYSPERRSHTYAALALDELTTQAFDDWFPVSNSGGTVVISKSFEPWYTNERRKEREFYWSAYSQYLLDVKHWDPDSVAALGIATGQVVERLSDPARKEAYQAKGLVVGYVQSGKTANFTGVLAKAVDAGYRLLIVLTGTIDLLREQTQRRIDMELVGRENILRRIDTSDPELMSHVDYQDDPDWIDDKFLRLGFLPSEQNYPDIVRLTTHHADYKSLKAGITTLEVERRDKSRPLYDPVNLYSSGARIAVVKKNTTVLTKLVKDLKSIKAHLGEIPTLIIDDESDQASVNTSNPKKWQEGQIERTATNRLISELLKLLPRAQYVGYTATPFANVFIDPSDVEDIFPKDFLLSLERPPGYMGVRDFHDLEALPEGVERTVANSQELAFVRDLVADVDTADRDQELRRAIDAFVIAGAIKLYREAQRPKMSFRHHTMLVHESFKQIDHADLADKVRALWKTGGYTSPAGFTRLAAMFYDDFLPVCQARSAGLPYPTNFDDLREHVGQAVARIATLSGDPVIIVNGDKDMAKEAIDFDRRSVWRILVGGTKLSRGFTVEGLTVAYYRRRTQQADTLMQMGRWFGFRHNYGDLVRLFIGRAEPQGSRKVDLYEAFDAIVKDEEAFREQLKQYAVLVDGKPQITPAEIPPLVSQHLPTLKPTAANKMYNAELVVQRTPGTPYEPVAYPRQGAKLPGRSGIALRWNFDRWLPLIQQAAVPATLGTPPTMGASFAAYVGTISHQDFVGALDGLAWVADGYFAPRLNYLKELNQQVDDWMLILPQTQGAKADLAGVGARSLFLRERRRDPLFGAISDPKHRPPALRIARAIESYGDGVVDSLADARRGAVLFYPVIEQHLSPSESKTGVDLDRVVSAFYFVTPAEAVGAAPQLVQFRTRKNQDQVTVDRGDESAA
jgi:hypothetical protein